MWLFVFFDLPTHTKKERKAAAGFRKCIMTDGFTMVQFNVYSRLCASKECADVHIKRIKSSLPQAGKVSIMQITDKQYGNMINFWGVKTRPTPGQPHQLELF